VKRFAIAAVALSLLAGPMRAGEAPPPSLDTVERALIGTWQSLGDTRFTREFDADGKAADRYDGAPNDVIAGRWSAFLGSAPPKAAQGRKLIADAFYVELDQQGDVLIFAVAALNAQSLQLYNLDRGDMLSFSRFR
jgi:hypothetical protein